MVDIVNKSTRRKMMSGIKGKNTKPELLVRSSLHHRGFRFRIHDNKVPGKPDLVLKKYNTVIFVHGCFWHKHNCHLFKWPKTNQEFWRNKIERNWLNDQKVVDELLSSGWRVCIIWECALKGKYSDLNTAINYVTDWLENNDEMLEVFG
jgi:DNA mismatch endonuclease (patch repair protein)